MMTPQENLELQIRTYDANYRAGTPLCTDAAFDKLMDEIRVSYPSSELLKKAVITQKPTTRKRKLPIPMYSLEKKKTVQEIIDWGNSIGLNDQDTIVITPKYDGCASCVDTSTDEAYTRGDGVEGQSITEHFNAHNSCEGYEGHLIGEFIISKENWGKYFEGQINKRTGLPYKSARNTVAGLLNKENVSEIFEELRHVDFVVYGNIKEKSEQKIQQLLDVDFNQFFTETFGTIKENIDTTYDKLNKFYETQSQFYQIDGIVLEVNDENLRKKFGRLPNNNPAYAIAYKNPEWSNNYITTVLSIEINVSKQGKQKPVIIVEPVDVDGVIVSRVTGYNMKYVVDNHIAEESEIEIVRSGDVIPKHLKTISYNMERCFDLMDEMMFCSSCGEPVAWDTTDTELICSNPNCEGIAVAKLEHFFSIIGVEEFARPSIESLYVAGYKTIKQILSAKKQDLVKIEGWGESSVDTLLNQFKQLHAVGVPMTRVLHALDVFNGVIGEKTCQLIFDNCGSFEDYKKSEFFNDLIKIKGVSSKTATAFVDGFHNYLCSEFIPVHFSYIMTPVKEVVGNKYEGMKVCFTGVRDSELEELIKSQGGEVVSGVSKTTTHLIVKDMSEQTLSSGKSVKAKSLGVKVIDIQSFKNN